MIPTEEVRGSSIKNIEAEAGVIASVLLKPELIFYSEQLKPNHFTDPQNAYVYWAVSELVKKGVDQVDSYNIRNMISLKRGTEHAADIVTIQSLNELIDVAKNIARGSPEDYRTVVEAVLDAAFRRETYNRLVSCERLCFNANDHEIADKIYATLDETMLSFSTNDEIPQYSTKVDDYWKEIEDRQSGDLAGSIPFKFQALNNYVTLERGELVVVGALMKQGKSMLLMSEAVDLLRKGLRVMYIDSELSSRLFTCRLISHLTGIEFKRVRAGTYTAQEKDDIDNAIRFMKQSQFVHIYMPMFDENSVYTAVNKIYHTMGIDVLIVDYLKSTGDNDEAFAVYTKMGSMVDMLKNKIAGQLNIAVLSAAQATTGGKLADSAKIARNASTILMLSDKTDEEIEADGANCGNKKLRVALNRNGPQHADNEYIDLQFNGNRCMYEDPMSQHTIDMPW